MTATYRFGRFELRPATRQLLVDRQPARLGARGFDVLHQLVLHRDRLVTKEELMDLVWPGLVVEENNLQVQISALRKLLGPNAIATIPGRGYRFALEIDEGLPTPTEPATALTNDSPDHRTSVDLRQGEQDDVKHREVADPASSAVAARSTWQRLTQASRRISRTTVLLLTLVVLVGLGIGVWTTTRDSSPSKAVVAYSNADRRMTFAVLPFEAPADDETAARIAVAMTEAVLVEMEAVPLQAQVAPRRSVEQALARHGVAKEVASSLNVHFLIRGNVVRVASGYKVDLLLVDVATDRVIDTQTIAVPAGALGPLRRADYRRATGWLIFRAAQTEVERTRNKPVEALDVRDLVLRAAVDWIVRKRARDEKGAYVTATDLLNRALALAPDDPLALEYTATVNLCDCVEAWSVDVEKQLAIGEAALDKYLRHYPDSAHMRLMRSRLFALRGRYEESLLIADSVLKGDPDSTDAAGIKAYNLLKLGRAPEALAAVHAIPNRELSWRNSSLAASIHYELGQYERAAENARTAITRMDREELANRRAGAVGLTLVAAEARLGHRARANAALAEFNAVVPGVQTISAIKKWMHPAADLAGNESLFHGLQLAGVSD